MTKFRNREGIQAVNAENRNFEALQGNYVDNGLEVTTDGEDMTLDVASGTVVQDNTEYDVGATTVTVSDNDEAEPRKDIVYVDDTQSVSIATGASESPEPALEDVEDVFNTARPSPPSLVNEEDVVVLAEVWVEDGATEIESDEIRDRRLNQKTLERLVKLESINSPITNSSELDNLEGNNLSIDSEGNLNAESDNETFSVNEFFVTPEPELTEVLYTGDDFADSNVSVTNNIQGGDVISEGLGEKIDTIQNVDHDRLAGLAVDPKDGTLWHTDADNEDLINIDRDGNEIQRLENVTNNADTEGLAIDPFDGTFWIVENDTFEVVNLDRDGNEIGSIDVSDIGDDSDSESITVDPASEPDDKRFFYGEGRDDEIHYIDENGNVIFSFDVPERNEGIDVDPRDGTLWIVFDENDDVKRYSRDGEEVIESFQIEGGANIKDISIDQVDNTLWINERDNNDISRWAVQRGWLIEKNDRMYVWRR